MGETFTLHEFGNFINEQFKQGQKLSSFIPLMKSVHITDWQDQDLPQTYPYSRLPVFRNEMFELILICWPPMGRSHVHDHCEAGCVVRVLSGSIVEHRFELLHRCSGNSVLSHFYGSLDDQEYNKVLDTPCCDDQYGMSCTSATQLETGGISYIENHMGLHVIRNPTMEVTYTIHLYSPPHYKSPSFSIPDSLLFQRMILKQLETFQDVADLGCMLKPMGSQELETTFEKMGVPLHLKGRQVEIETGLLDIVVKTILDLTVRTGHPMFLGDVVSGPDGFSVAADWVVSSLNAGPENYDIAPVFHLIEQYVNEQLLGLIDPSWVVHGVGAFVANNFESIRLSLRMALRQCYPDIARDGLFNQKRPIVFIGTNCTPSIESIMIQLGLGSGSLRVVHSNQSCGLCSASLVEELEKVKVEGLLPLAVITSCGCESTGCSDDLNSIAEICEAENLWLHVDGSLGAMSLFSPSYRDHVSGIEKASAISLDLHKILGVAKQCSVLLVRQRSFGRKVLQWISSNVCSSGERRADSFKYWMVLKARGTRGIKERVHSAIKLTSLANDMVDRMTGKYSRALPRNLTHCCFYYIPRLFRPFNPETDIPSIAHVAPIVRERIRERGLACLSVQHTKQHGVFLRLVFVGTSTSEDDVVRVFDLIDSVCGDIYPLHGL